MTMNRILFAFPVEQQLSSELECQTNSTHFSGKNRTVTDGPFAETKELVAGFWLWQVKSLEEAIEWVKRCPNPHAGDSDIEIRQVFEPEDFAPALSEEDIQQEKNFRAQLADKVAKK